MKCVQVTSNIKAEEKIEVRGVCNKDEQPDLERKAAPVLKEAEASFAMETKEGPETSETMSDGRSHGGVSGAVSLRSEGNACVENTLDIYDIYEESASYFVNNS